MATVDGHQVAAPHFGWGVLSSGPLCPLNSIPKLAWALWSAELATWELFTFFFFNFVIVSYAHTYRLLKAKLFKTFWAHSSYHTDEVILSLLVSYFPYITCKMK